MSVVVVKHREAHKRPEEVGRVTCQHCGSELKAERGDFTRVRGVGPGTPAAWIWCPVCNAKIVEAAFVWVHFSSADEERARAAYNASIPSTLHNLQYVAWEELDESVREEWRARVAVVVTGPREG